MPFDPHAAINRPYRQELTASLAGLVATRPARDVLALILAELEWRQRPAAVLLRAEVAALLSASVSPPEPSPARPSYDPSLWPNGPPSIGIPDAEQRDEPQPDPAPVQTQRAVPARKAAAPKPVASVPTPVAKRAKADRRPGDIGWKGTVFEGFVKRCGLASMRWDHAAMDYAGGNPMRKARIEALISQGWIPGDDKPDGYMIMRRAGEVLRIGHHGMVYMGLTGWWQMPRADRDALTDAGRPILARLALISAAGAALTATKARRAQLVKHFAKHRAAAKGAEWAKHALLTAKAEAGRAWRALQKARAGMEAARAA